MKSILVLGVVFCGALLSGCTGHVYNHSKNCAYDYLLHPAVSVSKIIGGCGDTDKLPQK